MLYELYVLVALNLCQQGNGTSAQCRVSPSLEGSSDQGCPTSFLMKKPVHAFAFGLCVLPVGKTPDSYHRCCHPVSQGTYHVCRARLLSSQSCHLTPKIILLCPKCHQFLSRAAHEWLPLPMVLPKGEMRVGTVASLHCPYLFPPPWILPSTQKVKSPVAA